MVLLLLVSVPGRPSSFSDGGCQGASQCPPTPLCFFLSTEKEGSPARCKAASNRNVPGKGTPGRGARAPYVVEGTSIRREPQGRPMAAPTGGTSMQRGTGGDVHATAGRGARAPYVVEITFLRRGTQGRPLAAPTGGRPCNGGRVGTFVRRRGAEPAPPTLCRLHSFDGVRKGGHWPPLRGDVCAVGYA